MRQMSAFYRSEGMRVQDFQQWLCKLGLNYTACTEVGPKGVCRSDLSFIVGGCVRGNVEVKNELAGGAIKDPVIQNEAYARLFSKQKGLCPMVLLQLCGCHYFQVFSALWEGDADSLLVADPLTQPLGDRPIDTATFTTLCL